jgi:hypothetical protein
MKGLFQERRDLRNASLEDLRQFLTELLQELNFRFSSISKENFGEKDLQEFASAILSNGNTKITVEDGVITIQSDEINLNGDVYVNGSPIA